MTRSLLGWTRLVTAQRLSSLLTADGIALVEGPVLLRALRLLGEGSKLDFADAYLGAIALETGPPAIVSFDADLDAVDGVLRISA